MSKEYQWQAVNPSNYSQRTEWFKTSGEAKQAFFSMFPRARRCNISASYQEGDLMLHGFYDPFIANVTKTTQLDGEASK